MSFSDVLTAVAEYVGDVLVNDCGRSSPDRVMRYFGTQGLPQDCCTEAGVLSITWDRGFASKTFPNEARDLPCPGKPVYHVQVMYDVCWKVPATDATGIQLLDDEWDADAAVLADVADCVARALMRLSCGRATSEAAQAVLDALHCDDFLFAGVVPSRAPEGGCARLTWSAYTGVRADSPAS